MHTWRALAAFCVFALGACGGHPDNFAASTLTAPPFSSPSALVISGPCDEQHQAHAISLAQSFIHARMHGCTFGKPSASFTIRFAHPQALGQPAPIPIHGWKVEFPLETVDTNEADPHNVLLQRACSGDPSILAPAPQHIVRVHAPGQRMQDPSDTANPSLSVEPPTGFAAPATRPLDAKLAPDDPVNLARAPINGAPVDPSHQEIPVPVDQVNTNLLDPKSSPSEVDVSRLGAVIDVFVSVEGRPDLL